MSSAHKSLIGHVRQEERHGLKRQGEDNLSEGRPGDMAADVSELASEGHDVHEQQRNCRDNGSTPTGLDLVRSHATWSLRTCKPEHYPFWPTGNK